MDFDYDLYEQVVENNQTVEGWALVETLDPEYDPMWDGQDLMSCDTVYTHILSNRGKLYRMEARNNSWDGMNFSLPVEVKSYQMTVTKWLTDGEAQKLKELEQ